jgi:hypothetical protein
MELSNAFHSFDPELRDALRDASAKEEGNAQALGEIEATKARAEGRLGELDQILKTKVDSGELARAHLPAAHRGAQLRAGQESAEIGFQSELLKSLQDAIAGTPEVVEKAISTNLQKYAGAIPSTDFYTRVGFDHTAKGVIQSFRQRVAEGQATEFERASKLHMSDAGSELAHRMATADAEAAPAAHADFKAYIDTIRQELPKSEVNGFVVQNVLTPAVAKLVDEHKFAEAYQLLHEAESLDVTGKGGLLSQTSAAKSAFATLRDHIERESKASTHIELDAYKAGRELRLLQGADEAGAQLQKLRLDNNGQLPLDQRFKMIDDYRRANAGDAVKVDAFASAVNGDYEQEDKFRSNERIVADLVVRANTLDKAKLDTLNSEVEAQYKAGTVPAAARSQMLELIGKRKALSGFVDEQDFRAFKKDVFAGPPLFEHGSPSSHFGDQAVSDLWEKLSTASQDSVETATTEVFKSALEQAIIAKSEGDPAKVAGIKSIALDAATLKAREYARSAVAQAVTAERKQGHAVAVTKQAQAIQQARVVIPSRSTWSALMGNTAEPQQVYHVREHVAKGIKDAPRKRFAYVPGVGSDWEASSAAQKTTPQAEWDIVATPEYFYYTRRNQEIDGIPRVLDMKELAKEATATGTAEDQTGNPERVAAARKYYGIAKGLLGFTPEEIKAGVTKHGVSFTASEIDYKSIPVFRSVVELEKNWNKGDFTPLYGELGDAIDPKNKMHPQDFYLAQLALLSGRK